MGSTVTLAPTADEPLGTADAVDEALRRSASTFRSPRMFDLDGTSAVDGTVHWKPDKSLWISSMTVIGVIGGPITFEWGALAVFVTTTAITICLGHSVGMHRRLIHRSFDCPLWLERMFFTLGALVGMAGPIGMIRQHDIRDWAQRKPACHPYLAHRSPILRDGFWQLHCELSLSHPPAMIIENRVRNDPYYRFLERSWMAVQIPLAIFLFSLGGIPWVIWGIAVRVGGPLPDIGLSASLPIIVDRGLGTSKAPGCRDTTSPIAVWSRWESLGTTIITPFQARRD